MSIKIGLLFPTRLSLYGDNANAKSLQYYLSKKGYESLIINIDDLSDVNLLDFDFLCLGSGRETGLDYVFDQLNKYADNIMNYINSNKVLLVTGNAVKCIKPLNICEIIETEDYNVSDVKALYKGNSIRGFQNTRYLVGMNDSPVFDLEMGISNKSDDKKEGYLYKHTIITTLIGPIIALNEAFAENIIDWIIE